MIYYIRYNVEHKKELSEYPWKVFQDEFNFYLTKNVRINTPSWTSETPFPDGGVKYSIYCDGTLTKCTPDEIIIE